MKKILIGLFLLMTAVFFSSCEKEELQPYEENPGIGFDNTSWTYSFVGRPNVDTITIPVSISGTVRDYDRNVNVEAVLDTNTTAWAELYELLGGTVRANSYSGSVKVVLKKAPELSDSIVKLKIRTAVSDDFKEVRLGTPACVISFTSKVVQPANWRWLRYYFGTPFSTKWWNFIVEKTGRDSFPYYPNQDPVIWWMDVGTVQAYAQIVKLALYEYNSNPANGGPLMHDDGPNKDEAVTMP